MDKKGIILVGHGSSMPYNSEVVASLADQIRNAGSWGAVGYSFMNMNRPSIRDAIGEMCKDPSVTTIIMSPVFIAAGVHIKEDVPEILGLAPGETLTYREVGGVERRFIYAAPFGPDGRLATLIEERAMEAVAACTPTE
ncbi:MAG: sirohydrochlorin nickelochelatase [Candidatus Methanofastidiosa archaeon]|nr:sirohydrochlorin nickelochelatase [Candidatus Methanofastidiosa archaeon]